jgi:alpha-soluble NSF attachment protein
MSIAEQEARDLLMKATKKANYTGWFGGNKYEEAAELYGRAANQFKLAKLCTLSPLLVF